MTRKKKLPVPTGKRYRSVVALLRDLNPGKAGEKIIRHIQNRRARDRRHAKSLGITVNELYLKQG